MRIRTIKPEFWCHPILAKEPDEVRLAAIGLLNIADDEGYFLASPALVRSALWPLDEDSTKARRTLARLCEIGYIEQYNHPTHGLIGYVVNFTKHQRVDRPTLSRIKTYADSTNPRRILDERSCKEGKGREGNREQGEEASPLPIDEFTQEREWLETQGAITRRGGQCIISEWKAATKGLKVKQIEDIFSSVKPGIQWPSEFKNYRKDNRL